MKRLARSALIGLLGLLTGALVWGSYGLYEASRTDGADFAEDLVTYRSYWLAPGEHVRFSVQAGKRHLRVLLNAAIVPEQLPAVGISRAEEHFYSLRYRLLAGDGTELSDRTYYKPLHVQMVNNRSRRALADRPAVPTDTGEIYLDLRAYPDTARVELSSGPASMPLAGMTIRPYYQERRAADKLDRIWQRLHEDKKLRVATSNVLNAEFLTIAERRNLVRWRWRPLVPVGIEERDYAIATLTDEPLDELDAAGEGSNQRWHLAAGRRATIGLNRATQLLVSASAADGKALQPEDLQLLWSGRFRHEQAKIEVAAAGAGQLQAKIRLGPGVVQFEATKDMWMDTADRIGNERLEPRVYVVRAYPSNPATVTIPVRHGNGEPTPLRLDVRTPVDEPVTELSIQFMQEGESIEEHHVDVTTVPSKLDWLRLNRERSAISAATRLYVNAPSSVDSLRVSTASTAWVAAYNRPANFARRMLIPESLFGGNDLTALLPNWFVLEPSAAEHAQAAAVLIESQLPGPHANPLPVDLRINERLLPAESSSGTTLLTLNDVRREISTPALQSTYAPLGRGAQTITLVDHPNSIALEPTLLLQQQSNEPAHLTIKRAGQTLIDLDLEPFSSGRVRLPEVAPGEQEWSIEAPPSVALWINHQPSSVPTWRDHAVQDLPKNKYTYVIERSRTTRETLTLRVFSTVPGRVRLSVRLSPWRRAAAPSTAWTAAHTVYDLALLPDPDLVAPLMRRADTTADGEPAWFSATAFHSIGADVPPGQLQATVETRHLELPAAEVARLYLGVTRSSDSAPDAAPIKLQRFEVSQR